MSIASVDRTSFRMCSIDVLREVTKTEALAEEKSNKVDEDIKMKNKRKRSEPRHKGRATTHKNEKKGSKNKAGLKPSFSGAVGTKNGSGTIRVERASQPASQTNELKGDRQYANIADMSANAGDKIGSKPELECLIAYLLFFCDDAMD